MAGRHARKIPLIGVLILGAFVLVRLGLMTYWSVGSADSHSGTRLLLYWILAMTVLAMLCRFAWQMWTGRHKTRWETERQ